MARKMTKPMNPPVYVPYIRPRFLMKSDLSAYCVAMIVPPSVVFGVAVLAIDLVLLSRKHEQHDHERDQRALRGHVEAEREAEDRNHDLVERHDEHVNDVA